MASPTAFPHHRHQSSLEGIIYPLSEVTLEADPRDQARRRFYDIIRCVEAVEQNSDGPKHPYNRLALVRLTYEYSGSEKSQDIFLQAFFQSVAIPIDGQDEIDFDNPTLEPAVVRFAEHLFDNFYLPRKCLPSSLFHLRPRTNVS